MGKCGETVRKYIDTHTKYWIWPPDQDHSVIYRGVEESVAKNKDGSTAPALLYSFELPNGLIKPYHVKSFNFAQLMEPFEAGDHLRIRRNKIGHKKYNYEVAKVEDPVDGAND